MEQCRLLATSLPSLVSLLVFLTRSAYTEDMKATLTSKGQITIPVKIRKRLGLEPGQVLDFDEEAPFLKATPVFDEDAMRAVRGCARGRLGGTADEWLEETRGPVSLPRAKT